MEDRMTDQITGDHLRQIIEQLEQLASEGQQ